MSFLRTLVNNQFQKSFDMEMKKIVKILIFFFFFIKSFFKQIINQYLKREENKVCHNGEMKDHNLYFSVNYYCMFFFYIISLIFDIVETVEH